MAEVEVACVVLHPPAARVIAGRQRAATPLLRPIPLLHWSSATKHPAMGWEQETRAECEYSPEICSSDAPDRVMRTEQDRTTPRNSYQAL
jgi:hypothetical protein